MKRCLIGIGSNLGNRCKNLNFAYESLLDLGSSRVVASSGLFETPAELIKDQPDYLNAAVALDTELDPGSLLSELKKIEARAGREKGGVRYGPRVLDLDILTYGNEEHSLMHEEMALKIPHERMHEREFVLLPLADIAPEMKHPILGESVVEMLRKLPISGGRRVVPIGDKLWNAYGTSRVMGILNVTPDSFSDGGRFGGSLVSCLAAAESLVKDGADIIDIGGESTRPMADEVSIGEEMDRVIPVVEALRGAFDVPLSVDTRNGEVAKAALDAGACIVNDVSGGQHDRGTVYATRQAEGTFVAMHMRGNPKTMMELAEYKDVVSEVCLELIQRRDECEQLGIPRWRQILDPGIGFAKNHAQNLTLLANIGRVRAAVGGCPILVGTSRKRFIGEILGVTEPEKRDWGTVGSVCSAVERGAFMVRVHSVKPVKDALAVMDAIRGSL